MAETLKVQLENQLEAIAEEFAGELARLKGFNLKNAFKGMTIILSAVPVMAPAWIDATPQDRKEAVVNVVNRHVDIPYIPESIEAVAFSIAYDLVAKKLGL